MGSLIVVGAACLLSLVGVALAAVFRDESIGPVQIYGGLAILVAAAIIQRSATPEPAGSDPVTASGGGRRARKTREIT